MPCRPRFLHIPAAARLTQARGQPERGNAGMCFYLQEKKGGGGGYVAFEIDSLLHKLCTSFFCFMPRHQHPAYMAYFPVGP
jgi:hypothetical protein